MSNITRFISEKILLLLIMFLTCIILVLLFFLFKPESLFVPSPSINNVKNSLSSTPKTIKIISSEKKFKNTSKDKWTTINLPNNNIKVLSSLKIDIILKVTPDKDAPENTSTGIIFYNKLPEVNPNTRRLSLYYYVKNKQWILKYQAGKKVKFWGILSPETSKKSNSFSLIISSDGKKAFITLPDKTSKSFTLPNTLYDISNDMMIAPIIGPKTNAEFTSLEYTYSSE